MKKVFRVCRIPLLALFTAVAVVALGSGHPFLPPHVVGFAGHRFCMPLTYCITAVDPVYGLSRKETQAVAQAAANIWNETADCELLEYAPDGRLEIRFLNPSESPTNRTMGRYYAPTVRIGIFRTDPSHLTELVAHEMGHALGLSHVRSGLMQPTGFCNNQPCLSDDDLEEMRGQYLFLYDLGRPVANPRTR